MSQPSTIAIIGDLSAQDDYLHEVQSAENFSESNLFYFAGTTSSDKTVGGIIRVANKPNQGYAEGTVLVFLGDGSALFKYERVDITGNTSWRAGGWDLDVITPGGVEFSSKFTGDVFRLKDPRILANPKLAVQEPIRALALDFRHFGKSPMVEFRYNRDSFDESMTAIVETRGLHQLTSFRGTFALDDGAVESVEGYGWRDHNWGPRNWQAFPRHAFYTGNFGDDRGFVLFQTEGGKGYFMHDGPETVFEVVALEMDTQYGADSREPVSMKAKVTLDNSAIHIITGQCADFIPLRNRRDDMTTHLGYSLWHYELDGQHKGMGVAEHMSQSRSAS